MLGSFYLINRNPYLTGPQKLVQARVVAQGVTVALIVASAALELGDARKGEGRYETVMVLDPDDPEHKHLIEKKVHKESYQGEDLWRDMVEVEERKMAERRKAVDEREAKDRASKSSSKSTSSSPSSSPSPSTSSSPSSSPSPSSKPSQPPSSASKSSTDTIQNERTNKAKSTVDPRNPGPGPATKQASGKENKDKMLNEINKTSDDSDEEVHKREEEKMRVQTQKEGDARKHAIVKGGDVVVSDRGEF